MSRKIFKLKNLFNELKACNALCDKIFIHLVCLFFFIICSIQQIIKVNRNISPVNWTEKVTKKKIKEFVKKNIKHFIFFLFNFICCGITKEKHQLLSDYKKKKKHLVMLTHFKITHIYSPKTHSTDQACENEEEILRLIFCFVVISRVH